MTTATASSADPVTSRGAWGLLALLAVANTLSYLDRQFLGVAAEPLHRDLGLSDVELGLLGGLSFALCYALFGLPLSRIVDRGNRILIVSGGLLAWSAATAACALAGNFLSLFVLRMLVGIGEAALAPAAYSLIGSRFPRGKIAKASGLYAVGAAAGTGLAILAGAPLLAWFGSRPMLGLHDWQASFLILGLLGIPLAAAIALTQRDPRRNGKLQVTDTADESLFALLWRERRFYMPLLVCACFYMAFLSGFLAWAPSLFVRHFGWTLAETGAQFGSLFLIANLIAGPVSGLVAGWLSHRARRDQTIIVCLACFAILIALSAIGPLMSSAPLAAVLLGIVPAFTGAIGALIPALIVLRTPDALRGRVIASVLFCMTLLGYGTGPVILAWFTESVLGDRAALHIALAAVGPTLLSCAFVALFICHRFDRQPSPQ